MKGIKFLIGALAAAGLLISVSATAQENANRDADGNVVRGPYETNAFWDNWFFTGGLGLNSSWNWANKGTIWFVREPGIALDLGFGKWFTPDWGARVRYSGITNNGFRDGAASFNSPQGQLGADFLINMYSLIDGYVETRAWNWIMYPTTGIQFNDSWNPINANKEWFLGLGSLVIWHPEWINNEKLSLTWDNRFVIIPDSHLWQEGGYIEFPFSMTFGIAYNLSKKNNFDRHSSVTPTIIPVPFTLEEYNALEQKVADLEKENAELKDKVAALEEENAKYRDLANGQTYEFKDGEFVATDSAKGAPVCLYFDCGKATLSSRELAHLEYFAQSVLDGDSKVVVTGSADKQTGTARVNQKLSEQRADYVKNLLIKKYGLKDENIETVADGDKNNLFDTPAKNRCVTIRVK
ncbi:MAG: OmpA family protein [Bacteroidales bacterium]|nr:OmpA family protein [Bacteroidales bacterium]